ncbi:DUF3783 domain-containing protein [Clostridium botulinum]|uniref:DUF3783 domain-containing protein n=1 Tax=Clostridium botulinum C/D str. DC5 TaxID=1443128 RepID=A0A0A0ILG0_CLOBO|nr:DUF3783 domain-containing protein [Clostridium botulinum]KEI03069.1 hypothetical protein Z952_08725 [Clostridium botulinum C/D str. BKT75002]KEI13485.1 hypothetical protein Z954_07310 [Clostridium botulinum C/D str. BKT2873]KGM94965.1 hypothetical protein Z956_06070 [Clostridium botulinum D str. CCUG 7971]KGN01753.1 hypothetical protein Z955_00835 [Clostridium botulinum C/D str. DC5]KOC49298.1 hypothetical protein ADU88_06355 [Clostridium botulinum]
MIESNKKVLLVYGFNENEKKSLKKLVMENKIPSYKCINKEMATTSLEFILNDINKQIYEGELPEEKVVLFNNCKDKDITKAISSIKETFHQNTIFAMITETSIKWSFKDLLDHLIEEREWFKNNSK